MSKNTTNALIAFCAGFAAGAVIGILYAPDKGKNTRDKLSFQLDKYKEKLKRLITDLKEGKQKATSEGKVETAKNTNKTIVEAEELMQRIQSLTDAVKAK